MKVERRGNQIHLHGYVCAAGRESRVLHHPTHGDFVETVEPGTFAKALEAAEDVKLTLNHGRELGSTRSNLALAEDAIGLKADAWTDDAEVMRAAERGELRGWSFTFRPRPGGDVWEDGKDGRPAKRSLRDIALDEVAVLTIPRPTLPPPWTQRPAAKMGPPWYAPRCAAWKTPPRKPKTPKPVPRTGRGWN